MTVVVGVAVAVVLLPFWIALFHYPVTQTPIPHSSRANYILTPQAGLNYFVVPYGALVLALPFIFLRGSRVPHLRPLLLGFWVAFMIGLGGTTPVGHLLLGRAFDVLTMERFSYWATLLALPFVGLLAAELVDRYRTRAIAGLAIAATATCALAVAWSSWRPADAENFKVDSVANWLNRDGHDNYRYVTLGFGNKISRLAVLTDASSVDGEWNSGRMLPELTGHGGARTYQLKILWQGRPRCAASDSPPRRPLRAEVGLRPRSLLRSAAVVWRVASRRRAGGQHHHRVEQRWCATRNSRQCSADATGVAGNHVGNLAHRQQLPCDSGLSHPRRQAA